MNTIKNIITGFMLVSLAGILVSMAITPYYVHSLFPFYLFCFSLVSFFLGSMSLLFINDISNQ